MFRKAIPRIINGFMYGTAITAAITAVIMAFVTKTHPDAVPVVPEFAAHFTSPYTAVLVQCIMSGLISSAFSGGSVVFESAHMGRLWQWVTYFAITSAVYIPVGLYCWGAAIYPQTRISMLISFSFTYFIMWIVEYLICKKNISEINAELQKLHNMKGQ